MLSRYDIEKECGKGINIVPFYPNDIKENSINFHASKFAWSMKSGTILWTGKEARLYNDNEGIPRRFKKIHIQKGKICVKNLNGIDYIILLPNSTTQIQTEEVLALDNRIGATYHSKVGMAMLGVGHIGTMAGPNFAGHSLISVHNVTDDPILIKVGASFLTLVFYYLKTPIYTTEINATQNGHLEKFAHLGITLSQEESVELEQDWKHDLRKVREHMQQDRNFIKFKRAQKKNRRNKVKEYLNLRNGLILALIFILLIGLIPVAGYFDRKTNSSIGTTMYGSVLIAGFLIKIIERLVSEFRKN